uniref:Alternative protein FREM3 n=1 Tax=Homo sapiens TaxID=9606 RepID=L8EAX0_HUMAN|nr:alternative protein FREM3 [Homo sapiens]
MMNLSCTLGMLNITSMKVLATWRFVFGEEALIFPNHHPSPCAPESQSRSQQKLEQIMLVSAETWTLLQACACRHSK